MSGAAPFRCPRTSRPRDSPGEESDGDSKTPTSSVIPSEEEEEEEGHRVSKPCTQTPWDLGSTLSPCDPST